jgi:uncharacterized membrane protein YraQ (UPF0718 family)
VTVAPAGAVLESPRARIGAVVALAAFAALAVIGLSVAKWDPYGHKLAKLLHSHLWSGKALVDTSGKAPAAPSLHGAWAFTVSYGKSVWLALVVALVLASALEACIPRARLVSLLSRRTRVGGVLVAGLLAVPCMMCTCCSAPLAATLRRRGVPTGSVLGYWLGNPVLNPAVLAFLALVGPWQWVVTRLVVGGALVFGGSAIVDRLVGDRRPPASGTPVVDDEPLALAAVPGRFVRTLGRLAVVLVPEYLAVVLAVGALRGWLFPLGASAAHWGILAVVVAAVAGTLMVVPTAGEIPVLQGLAAVGLGSGAIGALLLTLPAISAPSMAMTGRALSWRAVGTMAGVVCAAGVMAGALLWVLT